MLQELINQKSKEETVQIKVGDYTFILSAYCYKKVELTENMKFRIKCKENPDFDREFDDIAEMTHYIGEFVYSYAIYLCM